MDVFPKSEIEHGAPNNRPRCICNPNDTLKFVSTYFNHVMLESIKQIQDEMKWFHIGFNSDESTRMLNECVAKNEKNYFACYDGSGHDAHQWSELIQSVDNRLIRKHYDAFFEMTGWEMDLYKPVLEALLRTDYVLHVPNRNDHRDPYLIFGMRHGVPSGLAHRTTLGNTIRVYFYIQFVLALADQKADIFVAGDDAMLIFNQNFDCQKFDDAFWQVYSRPGQARRGLGQVAKKIDYSDKAAEFLSKDIIYHVGEVLITRKPIRVLFGSNHTKTVQITPIEHAGVIAYTLALWAGANPIANSILSARKLISWFTKMTVDMDRYIISKKYQLMTMYSTEEQMDVDIAIWNHYGNRFVDAFLNLW
jgi:hypothetical protein